MGNDENTWREEGIPKIRSSCILCTTAKHPKLLVIVPSPNQRAELRRSNAIRVPTLQKKKPLGQPLGLTSLTLVV